MATTKKQRQMQINLCNDVKKHCKCFNFRFMNAYLYDENFQEYKSI